MHSAQARLLEPIENVLGHHSLQRLPEGAVDRLLTPRRDPTEVGPDLRKIALDRRLVGAVWREEYEPGARPPYGRYLGMALMGLQPVPDDHVARTELQ